MRKRILSMILVLVMVAGVLPTVAYADASVTVTYNPGTNGVGSVLNDTVDYGANYQLAEAIYTRTGYVQTGWATSDLGSMMYLCEYTIASLRNNLNLYPTWGATSYLVTVNVNKDGSAWNTGAPTITFGTTSASAVANGTSVANGTYNIYANGTDTGVDVTVSGAAASATLNYYTVTFKNDDNTSTLNTQTVLSGQTAVYGGATPTKTATAQYSYAFSKWVTTAGGATDAMLSNITAAKTVYASFTQTLQTYTITWKSAGLELGTTTVAYGGTPTYSTPTNPGYDFTGWNPSIVSVTGNATYNASWTGATYTISYTLNGGTATNPTSYTFPNSAITLNNPTREGFTFLGWTGSNGGTAQTSVTINASSSGARSYTANWKANAPAAPEASIVTAKTDTTLTITTETGYEYSVNGTSWYSGTGSYTFTGLTASNTYNLVCRVAAVTTGNLSAASDPSAALSVTTKNAAPAAPTIAFSSITANSVTITTITGAEYSKDNGATWQEDNSFSSLTHATQYTFAIRIKETANTVAGIKASVAQYTAATTPDAGAGYSINFATEKITVNSGYEVNTDAGFGVGTAIVNNASVNPSTTYYIRVAASGGVPASAYVSFTLPARTAAPTGITADKTRNSITVTIVAGQEYKINSGAWQDSGSFTGLSSNTDYTVYTRVKATDTAFASADYSMSVTTKSLGSVTVPTSAAVTYNPAKTLADINLTANWAWSASTTVPTVAISGYSAVYTPTDTATVDYSGEEGYANISGTVTITRTIALTVNRAAPTAADFTYDAPAALDYSGTAKTAGVTANGGISGMGSVTVRYYPDGAATPPINTGTYTVKIDIAQGENYAAASAVTDGTWTFTIGKMAQAPLSIANKPTSDITYGDTFTLGAAGGSGTGTVTWEVTDGTSATVNVNTGAVTITGVNETTITATRAADGNYLADVTDTYTFTPAKLQLTVALPTAIGGWIKTYNGGMEFDKFAITVEGMTNKVGSDDVTVSVVSATYDTADVGSGDKTITITYVIAGAYSENYSAPSNTVVNTASITAATPTIALVTKTAVYTGSIIEINAATVTGVAAENDITANYAGVITYTYYTKDTCTDGDKTTEDNSGAESIGGAPKNASTYYVKATIAANGNYAEAASTVSTLTIYNPSSGGGSTPSTGAPVIVDGKTVDMGTTEVKDDTTTVTVDPIKMSEQLKNTMDSVVIPIISKTGTASAQLVVQNVESMAERGVSLTIIAGNISYSIPSGAIDTSAALKALGASDSSKVPLNITISKLSNSSVTIQNGTLMMPPVAFTVTATYNGKSIAVERFGSYVQRVIDIPDGTDPKSITTAVVVEADGAQRHVPTEVYSENGKWYARINAMTNSTYALIQNSVSFTDSKGKWYDAAVTEMASREIISGVGENMFAGERAITRAEFTAIIVRALGLPTKSTAAGAFSDVSANKWYYGSVGTAYEYGLVTGKGEVQFDPTGNITRQEAMVILQRAAKLTDFIGKTSILSAFSDSGSVDKWALEAAKWNVGSGLIMGNKGQLRPTDNISRAETAAVILRLLQMAELIDVRS